jgi:hypothetical protein
MHHSGRLPRGVCSAQKAYAGLALGYFADDALGLPLRDKRATAIPVPVVQCSGEPPGVIVDTACRVPTQPPTTGEELPNSVFTRKRKHLYDFNGE